MYIYTLFMYIVYMHVCVHVYTNYIMYKIGKILQCIYMLYNIIHVQHAIIVQTKAYMLYMMYCSTKQNVNITQLQSTCHLILLCVLVHVH